MLLSLLVGLALAAEPRAFSFTFRDEAGDARTVRFELDAAAVRADVETPLGFPRRAAAQAQVEAIRDYAATVRGPKVTAKAQGGSVAVRVTGKDRGRMREALRGAEDAGEAALDAFLEERRWTRDGRKLLPDHPRLVEDYADALAPAARELARGLDLGTAAGRRAYAERAVRFVQSLAYERRKGGGDKGYRPPLAVLAKARGDCDSKAVLYLALLRAGMPQVDSAVVYIPRHAFVALDLPADEDDVTVRVDGDRWVIAEPVGPARAAVGDGGRKSKRRARLGLVDVRPVGG